MGGAWEEHGRSMGGAWEEHGRSMGGGQLLPRCLPPPPPGAPLLEPGPGPVTLGQQKYLGQLMGPRTFFCPVSDTATYTGCRLSDAPRLTVTVTDVLNVTVKDMVQGTGTDMASVPVRSWWMGMEMGAMQRSMGRGCWAEGCRLQRGAAAPTVAPPRLQPAVAPPRPPPAHPVGSHRSPEAWQHPDGGCTVRGGVVAAVGAVLAGLAGAGCSQEG